MPIIKDREGTELERFRAYFDGSGDIRVTAATRDRRTDNYNILCLTQAENGKIGRKGVNDPNTTIDELGPKIILEFEKPESVDVVIKELKEIKLNLIANISWKVSDEYASDN